MIENLLRTVVGAGLIYFFLCLLVSGINLAIAEARGSRGKFLKMGIRGMLPDPPLFRRVMQHPLISGMYRAEVALGKAPSHLAPGSFASALVEVVRSRAAVADPAARSEDKMAQLRRDAETLKPDHPIVAQSLLTIIDRSDQSYEDVFRGIEAWFDAAMERVRVWYARYTRRRLFLIAFVLAALFNIDAFHVVRVFWVDGREAMIVAPPTSETQASTVRSAPKGASGRPGTNETRADWPVGHPCFSWAHGTPYDRLRNCFDGATAMVTTPSGWPFLLGSLLGWLATAFLVALGAPGLYRMLTRSAPR